MLLEKDIEFFVRDPLKDKDIITAHGLFLHPSAELRQKYSSFGSSPEESTRVFFYVEDYGLYVKNIISDSTFVMQNDLCLTTLEDYSRVYVYYKEKDGQWKKIFVFAPRDQDGECLNLYHAAMGLSGNAYCSTSGEKLIKVNIPKPEKFQSSFPGSQESY